MNSNTKCNDKSTTQMLPYGFEWRGVDKPKTSNVDLYQEQCICMKCVISKAVPRTPHSLNQHTNQYQMTLVFKNGID